MSIIPAEQHNLARRARRAAHAVRLVSCCGWCWTAIRLMGVAVVLVAVTGLAWQMEVGHALDHVTMAALAGGLVVVCLRPSALRREFNSSADQVAQQVAIAQAHQLEPTREVADVAFARIRAKAVQASINAASGAGALLQRARAITARVRSALGSGAPDLTLHPRLASALSAGHAALKAA